MKEQDRKVMRISFKRATDQQRKEFLADDVAAVYDLMKEVVESGNYTAAKMLKLQFLLGESKDVFARLKEISNEPLAVMKDVGVELLKSLAKKKFGLSD